MKVGILVMNVILTYDVWDGQNVVMEWVILLVLRHQAEFRPLGSTVGDSHTARV